MSSKILENCNNCLICVEVCPTHSIMPTGTRVAIDSDTCMNCQFCVRICPVDAIEPAPEDPKK